MQSLLSIVTGFHSGQENSGNPPPDQTTFSSPNKAKLFTDPRDGQTYKTVELLGKTWLAENLNYDVGEGCWFYNNDPKNGIKYGRLYTWEAAKKACPPSWHLPSHEEIAALIDYYGSQEAAYKELIEGGKCGFNALLGGYRVTDSSFLSFDVYGLYWSATERDGDFAYYYGPGFGFSVRCLQN